jgi:hypothetical protein
MPKIKISDNSSWRQKKKKKKKTKQNTGGL